MFVSFNLHPPLVLSVTESLNITHVAQGNKSAILLQNYKGKWVWCPWDIIHNTGRANDEELYVQSLMEHVSQNKILTEIQRGLLCISHPSVILTISLQNTKIRMIVSRENIIFLSLDIIVLFFVKIFILSMYGTISSVDIDEQRIKFDDGSYTGDIMRHVSCCTLCNNSNDLTRCCLVIKHFLGFPLSWCLWWVTMQ